MPQHSCKFLLHGSTTQSPYRSHPSSIMNAARHTQQGKDESLRIRQKRRGGGWELERGDGVGG